MTSVESVRSVGRQMRHQRPIISVRGQTILCWKLGRGCHYLLIYLLFDWQRWATKHILQNSSTKKMSG